MNKVLFGYTGFVGGYLLKNYKFDAIFNSKNIQDARHIKANTVFFAALPAAKWLANKNPKEDWENIKKIMNVLETIEVVERFVLISTIDVYGYDLDNVDELSNINENNSHPYGLHRKKFEDFTRSLFGDKAAIVRLPGLFGLGLKKNIIYDLLQDDRNHNNNNINLDSSFQWFNMKYIKDVIDNYGYFLGIPAINIVSSSLTNKMLIDHVFQKNYQNSTTTTTTIYNVKSILYKPQTTTEILHDINMFVNDHWKIFHKKRLYTIGISCIALAPLNINNNIKWKVWNEYMKLVNYNELAPTMFDGFSWDNNNNLLDLKLDLPFYSMQSITYGQHFNIFSPHDWQIAVAHLRKVINLAKKHDVKRIVFGCPKNRRIPEGMINQSSYTRAISFFQTIVDITNLDNSDCIICIENNSTQYGCNFLITPEQVEHFVRQVNRKSIKMMIDTGNAIMENINPCTAIRSAGMDVLSHIHIGFPNMRPNSKTIEEWNNIAATLQNIGYTQGVTLEMLPENIVQCTNIIEKFAICF